MEVCNVSHDLYSVIITTLFCLLFFRSHATNMQLMLTQLCVIASAVSCGANFYCATQQSFVGCCEISSCAGVVTTCYDILGSICDAACQQNTGNLVWSVNVCNILVGMSNLINIRIVRPLCHTVPPMDIAEDQSAMDVLSRQATRSLSCSVSRLVTGASCLSRLNPLLPPPQVLQPPLPLQPRRNLQSHHLQTMD